MIREREVQIRTTMRPYLVLRRMAVTKKTDATSFSEDVERLEPSYAPGGHVKWAPALGIPQNLTHNPEMPFRYVLRRKHQNLYTNVHGGIILKCPNWKQPKCHQLMNGKKGNIVHVSV